MTEKYDIAVVGAGPGGYVAAIRAAQLGSRVALIERDRVGGTCMNWGCIPTKFLLHQTKLLQDIQKHKTLIGPVESIRLDWERVLSEKTRCVARLVKGIEFLLEKNGIDLIRGAASLRPGKRLLVQDDFREIAADRIILAAGSRPAELPFLQFDGKRVLSSRDALDLPEIPRSLLIIGAGAIGLEMGTIYQRLGCDVHIVELLPQVLPGSDPDLAKRLERLLKRQKLKVHTGKKIDSARIEKDRVILCGTDLKSGEKIEFTGEKALVSVGRSPVRGWLVDADPELAVDARGFVVVDDRLETGVSGIYAIGDLIGGKLLAHKASHEGIFAAENALGADHRLNEDALPLAVFTDPEFAAVGLTEQETAERFGSVKTGLFSLQANGRALTMESPDGLVKIVADGQEQVRGAHILAPHASEMIPELTLAIGKALKLADVADSIHIHPTLSESMMEAALNACGRAIHMLNV